MKIPAATLALGAAMALAAPAQALVSFAGSIDAKLRATSLPSDVSLSYGFSNYEGYAEGFGDYEADWSDDFMIDAGSMTFAPAVSGSTDALAVIEASSLNDASVTLENLGESVSTVDFLLSYDLKATAEKGGGAIAKAYASLAIEAQEARPSISRAIDVYAGGDYGRKLAQESGAWSFSVVLKPGERMTLAIYADTMGYLEETFAASEVPLPGTAALAAAGLAALGGAAALRRRRRVPT